MKKRLFSLALIGLSLVTFAQQKADFNVVPLPRHIEVKDSANTFVLRNGATIAFPKEDAEMTRNAEFLQQYVEQSTGIQLILVPNAKKADIMLSLYPEKQRTDHQETYTIIVGKKGISLQANKGEGIFRAIQTLRKALPIADAAYEAERKRLLGHCLDNQYQGPEVRIPWATIHDEPRFAYRGQHLDCARHFFSVEYIKEHLDILALHGVNQFHWHITDDQGWRFEVKALPELAKKACIRKHTVLGHNCFTKGAYLYDGTEYGRGCYYTQEQIRDIVKYAQERYINIIPEIDLPGHMVAAMHVFPDLGCTGGPYDVWPIWGVSDDVLCAGNPKTMEFLKTVLGELCDVFPSKYIHIGGDESPRTRWKACPKCQAKMKELGLSKEAQLQTYINKELDKFLADRGRTLIGWDETLEGGLSENAVVMSWRGYEGGYEAARQHHRVIMTPTSHCYIDYYQLRGDTQTQPLAIGGYVPVSKVYSMEPVPDKLTEEEQKYIWGVQVNLWTEYVLGPDHVQYMLLPRLAAMSEVQWLLPQSKNFDAFTQRLIRLEQLYQHLGYKYCTKYE